jgi:NTP pyrophosphohydrolases including oxidative damage repair enzymes
MDLDRLRSGPLEDVADPAPVVSSEVVYAGRVWDIRSDTVTFAGHELTREYTAHTGAVAVLALDDGDRVLLINQYRQPIGTRDWELPAGLLDVAGEPPLEAARRELAEETDLVAAHWEPLVSFHSSPGGSNEVIHVFLARGLAPAPETHERTEEESEIVVRWAPLSEVVAAVLDGRVRNAPLMLAVLALQARRGSAAAD